MTRVDLEKSLDKALLELLAAARLLGGDALEVFARKMITAGGAGYIEAMGPQVTAECFYRMADGAVAQAMEASKS